MLPPLETIAWLRTTIGDHPLGTFVVLAIVWLAVTQLAGRRAIGNVSLNVSRSDRRASLVLTLGALAGLIAIAGFARIAGWYAGSHSYYDFAEPTIAAIAWLFKRGQPIYHAMDAADRYSHMYGPAAFFLPASFMGDSPSIPGTKLIGLKLTLMTLSFIGFSLHETTRNLRRTLALTGLFALLCLMFRNTAFWIRPDSWMLMYASLALAGSLNGSTWFALSLIHI